MRRFCLCLALCAISQLYAQEIDQKQVNTYITHLASDEMKGRLAGSPEARKAALYIAEAYKKAGLKPFPGEDSLLQKFNKTRISVTASSLTLNGVTIPEDKFVITTEAENFELTSPGDIKVVSIGADQDPRMAFGALRGADKALVVLHSGHERIFGMISHRMKSATYTDTPNPNKVIIIALADDAEVTSVHAKVSSKAESIEMANVVGILPGKSKPDEMVMFSAHYDHIGTMDPVNGDSIANGADDDASGTTALMILADYFKRKNINERTLVFAAFTAEEMGGFGSKYMSGNIKPDQFVAGLNIEMIGKHSKFGARQGFVTGYELSDLGKILQKNLEGKPYGFHPDPYPEQRLFWRSDNTTFARLGIPAHSISTTQIDKDQYYHTVDDEVETLDIPHLTDMIRAIGESATTLVNGTDTPTRIEGFGPR